MTNIAVNKLGWVSASFFFTLTIFNISGSELPVQTNYWGVKILLLLALFTVFFFLPYWWFDAIVPRILTRVGAVLFVLFQVLVFLGFAFSLSDNFDDESTTAIYALNVFAIFLFLTAIAGFGYLTYTFTGHGFDKNLLFCFSTFLFCVVYTSFGLVRSNLSSEVEDEFFTSSVVSLYSVFSLWSSLRVKDEDNPENENFEFYTSLILTFLSLLYTTFSTSSFFIETDEKKTDLKEQLLEEAKVEEKEEKTEEATFFNLIMLFASFYSVMLSTNWGEIGSEGLESGNQWSKFIGVVLTGGVYTWALLAPTLDLDE
eukprot:snap_masked-scaffold_15-processed-gene-7.3-mRNA-1 protein AED:1.00 eAED:1.00 QI:0/-1/0/0/-1/1/1/0/313